MVSKGLQDIDGLFMMSYIVNEAGSANLLLRFTFVTLTMAFLHLASSELYPRPFRTLMEVGHLMHN